MPAPAEGWAHSPETSLALRSSQSWCDGGRPMLFVWGWMDGKEAGLLESLVVRTC